MDRTYGEKDRQEKVSKEIQKYNKILHKSHKAHQKGLLHPSFSEPAGTWPYSRPNSDLKSPKIGTHRGTQGRQSAHSPLHPVRPTLTDELSHILYLPQSKEGIYASFSDSIIPKECGWVYGKTVTIEEFYLEYTNEEKLQADIIFFTKSIVAFKLPEYNPDVSLSYIWGNKSYPLKRMGSLPHSYVPIPKEYEQGEQDNNAIVYELSYDLQEILQERRWEEKP